MKRSTFWLVVLSALVLGLLLVPHGLVALKDGHMVLALFYFLFLVIGVYSVVLGLRYERYCKQGLDGINEFNERHRVQLAVGRAIDNALFRLRRKLR